MPVTLADILSFTTGLRQIPPLGLKENGGIVISYLRNLDTKIYPLADACFNNIKLPTCHQNRDSFFSKMDEGTSNSLHYFGRLWYWTSMNVHLITLIIIFNNKIHYNWTILYSTCTLMLMSCLVYFNNEEYIIPVQLYNNYSLFCRHFPFIIIIMGWPACDINKVVHYTWQCIGWPSKWRE